LREEGNHGLLFHFAIILDWVLAVTWKENESWELLNVELLDGLSLLVPNLSHVDAAEEVDGQSLEKRADNTLV
jgi:hypothetical protein